MPFILKLKNFMGEKEEDDVEDAAIHVPRHVWPNGTVSLRIHPFILYDGGSSI